MQQDMLLTGYVYGTTWLPGLSEPYGSPLAPFIAGSLHDHTALWRVDLDVGGTANYVQVTKVKPEVVTDYTGWVRGSAWAFHHPSRGREARVMLTHAWFDIHLIAPACLPL